MSKKITSKKAKFKSVLCGFVAVAACFAMFASACTETESGEEETGTSTRVDEQDLKNGNFEFFEDNDGTYIIGSPDNWSSGTGSSATASDSQSGVIGTTVENWNSLTDPDLPQTLWDNAKLDEDDDDYVEYNATPFDLPFTDPASAILENEDYDEDDEDSYEYYISEDAAYINNPYTHEYRWVEEDGETVLYNAAGEEVTYYYNEDDGKYYLDEDYTEEIESNVLMIHNYVEDDTQGTQTYYTSSTTLTLEANTAAKISVWVKTSDLYFGSNNDTRTEVIDQRGAYIELAQTVGGTSVDSFRIENINTEILNPYNEETGEWENGNNGWVQYTLYISACDYAETTITLTVGLGQSTVYTLEGYAFFDDIEYTKYLNVDAMIEEAGYENESSFYEALESTTCNLLSEADDRIFRVDKEMFNDGGTTVGHYSNDYSYFIDLAVAGYTKDGRQTISLGADNVSAGLTEDEDGYVSSSDISGKLNNVSKTDTEHGYLPLNLDISTDDDIIATFDVSDSSWTSVFSGSNYSTILEEALSTAESLPGSADASTLLILSARGASYEAVISDSSFILEPDEYMIISFWVKTSELNEKTTVTVSARQTDKTSNSGSFEVDSTTIDVVTINDEEDVYDGWVQCYALVSNTLDEDSVKFELVVNYGVTTIKDTTSSSYYGGWVAVTNISTLTVSEEAFGYADSDTRAAVLTLEESTSEDDVFDETWGNGNEIETSVARPANYNGVNGGSASVTSESVDISDYDNTNQHDFAGLINKDYREAYEEYLTTYLATYLGDMSTSSAIYALFSEDLWNEVLANSYQPLLIVNTVREFAEKTSGIYNYGYIANSSSSVSSSTYTVVSVRVWVSKGAVASVYLVDPTSKDTLAFTTPEYTFWYDNDGNALKGEPDEDWTRAERLANIAYTLRDDGLYEDEDGNLYANLYNYEREYYDEHADYYDGDGNLVTFDNLVDGEIYYANSGLTEYAPHYLVTSDGERVYSYVSGVIDESADYAWSDVIYNYMVESDDEDSTAKVADTDTEVRAFDPTVAEPRYTQETSSPYSFTIDTIENPDLAEKWITVNFFIHTGSEEKEYRLEVWSGTRDEETTEGVAEGSYVLFDYSAVSVDESTYSELLDYYTGEIIEAYQNAITEAHSDVQFDSDDETLAYYEELAEEYDVEVDLYNYEALYYTYTLYDSATYVPFNEDTAEEDESGYNYAYSDYSETLAFLKVDDTSLMGAPMLNMFIDYSATDKSITITSTSDVTDDEEDTTSVDDTNIWLLASSIIMVVAILIAIAVVIFRDLHSRFRRKTQVGKNTYNYKKNKRYVRTYVKEHGETPVNNTDNTQLPEDVNPGGNEPDGEAPEGDEPDGGNN